MADDKRNRSTGTGVWSLRDIEGSVQVLGEETVHQESLRDSRDRPGKDASPCHIFLPEDGHTMCPSDGRVSGCGKFDNSFRRCTCGNSALPCFGRGHPLITDGRRRSRTIKESQNFVLEPPIILLEHQRVSWGPGKASSYIQQTNLVIADRS